MKGLKMMMISTKVGEMKKGVLLLIPLTLLIVSCAKELVEMPGMGTGAGPVFSAFFSGEDQTRTVMDSDQKSVLWSATDKINVFDGDEIGYEFSASGAGASTTFTKTGGETTSESDMWYALYPYDSKADLSDGVFTTTLKDEYTVTSSGTFTDGMNISVAKSTSLELSFKNVLSWIRVASGGLDDVVKIEFRGNNDELVAGKLAIDYTGDVPVATIVEGTGSKVMTVNVENYEQSVNTPKEKRIYFYVPVLPGTYSKGFNLSFTSSTGVHRTFIYENEMVFNRGKKRGMFADLSGTKYKKVTRLEEIDEVENARYLLVYPSGTEYRVFSFQKTMENAVSEAERLTDVHSLEELKRQGTQIYQNVLKANYVTALSDDGGETITIDPIDEQEAVVVVSGSYRNAETTLSASVEGKDFTLRLENITASLNDNNAAMLSAVLNGEDLVDITTTLRGHELTLTLGNCIDYVGPKCGMNKEKIALAKDFFSDVCTMVHEYTGKPFNVTLNTTVTDFYRQYWDNIRDYALRFGGEKKWGSIYPLGFYKADDGFTFNVPVPNKVWFSDFEESTSGTIDDFVAYWSARDGYHDFPFKKLAEKFAEKLDDETFEAIKSLNFDSLGSTYQRYVDRFNDSLEEVFIYKLVE